MRRAACESWVELHARSRFVFLTGDLGYGALEPLRDAIGGDFVNAGVAEQCMVSVAAGIAREGLRPWVYSIAPFTYARPFEQVRNDVCQQRLPVVLVGNGGGYAYGVMGASHHALEDYGVLLTLPGLRAHVPAFADDVRALVPRLARTEAPAYLRLGRCEKPAGLRLPHYGAWRKLAAGERAVAIVVGPLAGSLLASLATDGDAPAAAVWVLSELPIEPGSLPDALLADLRRAPRVLVAEEHVAQGSAGAALARAFLLAGLHLERFEHAVALGHPSGRFGSQEFHRRESGLDAASLARRLRELAR